MAVYHGLLMGCAKEYWKDVIKDICDEFYKEDSNIGCTTKKRLPFTWNDVYKKCPNIGKKQLSRLSSSEWIIKYNHAHEEKIPVKRYWILSQEAIELFN